MYKIQYDILAKTLESDVDFNSMNLQKHVTSRGNKLHQWIYRLRSLQQNFYEKSKEKDILLDEIIEELENGKVVIMGRNSIKEKAMKDKRFKDIENDLKNMEMDISYIKECVDCIKWIGQDHERLVKLLQLEKI